MLPTNRYNISMWLRNVALVISSFFPTLLTNIYNLEKIYWFHHVNHLLYQTHTVYWETLFMLTIFKENGMKISFHYEVQFFVVLYLVRLVETFFFPFKIFLFCCSSLYHFIWIYLKAKKKKTNSFHHQRSHHILYKAQR